MRTCARTLATFRCYDLAKGRITRCICVKRVPLPCLPSDVGFCDSWRLEIRNNIFAHIYDIVGREGESSKITRLIGNLSSAHRVHYYYYFITENNAQFYCVLDLDFAGVCAWPISPAQFPIRVTELGRGNSHNM